MNINHQKLIIIEYMPFFWWPLDFYQGLNMPPGLHWRKSGWAPYGEAADGFSWGWRSKNGPRIEKRADFVGFSGTYIYIYILYIMLYMYIHELTRGYLVYGCFGMANITYWLHSKDLSLSWIYQRNIMKCGPFPPKTRCQSFLRRGQKALLTL